MNKGGFSWKRFAGLSVGLVILLSVAIAQAQPAPPLAFAWKEGIIMGLTVPSKTTKEQLKTLIHKLRQAKKDNNLASLIPPVNLGLKDKYVGFILLIFSDQKWATQTEYKKYERADDNTSAGRATSRAYLNHIAASYSLELADGKEEGALGYYDGIARSAHFKKLF